MCVSKDKMILNLQRSLQRGFSCPQCEELCPCCIWHQRILVCSQHSLYLEQQTQPRWKTKTRLSWNSGPLGTFRVSKKYRYLPQRGWMEIPRARGLAKEEVFICEKLTLWPGTTRYIPYHPGTLWLVVFQCQSCSLTSLHLTLVHWNAGKN